MSTAFILGAGFSHPAGLPLQDDFSNLLFAGEFSGVLDTAISSNLKTFLSDVFGWCEGSFLPSLEDIFTYIDLSTATGHDLGIKYKPKLLRALRRMAIYRIFSVLDRKFSYSPDITMLLQRAMQAADGTVGFVVLNWDIVLEKHLAMLLPPPLIDYCCDAFDWNQPDRALLGPGPPAARICKMHGSSNWAYCENCNSLFYDLNQKLALHSKVGLIKADFRLFDERFTDSLFDQSLGISPAERTCRFCKNIISSHIATFSYRKSFRSHAYPAIWHRAGDILAHANKWVFIGYSLPSSDFELKHLLKSAELRFAHLRHRPTRTIDVVVRGDAQRKSHEQFFGTGCFEYYSGGLAEYVNGSGST